jgi:hypothetical protein
VTAVDKFFWLKRSVDLFEFMDCLTVIDFSVWACVVYLLLRENCLLFCS